MVVGCVVVVHLCWLLFLWSCLWLLSLDVVVVAVGEVVVVVPVVVVEWIKLGGCQYRCCVVW